jgi:hypothetical protein
VLILVLLNVDYADMLPESIPDTEEEQLMLAIALSLKTGTQRGNKDDCTNTGVISLNSLVASSFQHLHQPTNPSRQLWLLRLRANQMLLPR